MPELFLKNIKRYLFHIKLSSRYFIKSLQKFKVIGMLYKLSFFFKTYLNYLHTSNCAHDIKNFYQSKVLTQLDLNQNIISLLQNTLLVYAPYKQIFKQNPVYILNLKDDHLFTKSDKLTFVTNNKILEFVGDQQPNNVNKAEKKVSIILPAYNAEKTIEQAIHSIQQQTYKNFELLVVNDCSSDNTKKIVQRLAQDDSRISIFSSNKNYGSYYCRNLGITKASGHYITFHDADDISRPDRLTLCLEIFANNPSVEAVYSNYIRVDQNGEAVQNWLGSIYRKGLITFFINASVLKHKLGYFDIVRTSADSEFFERAQKLKIEIKKINEVLYYARSSVKSLTTQGLFKSHSSEGMYLGNKLRERYYISYKIHHQFNKNLYLKAFPKQRIFWAPDNILSHYQKK